jgi:hypothetical protein
VINAQVGGLDDVRPVDFTMSSHLLAYHRRPFSKTALELQHQGRPHFVSIAYQPHILLKNTDTHQQGLVDSLKLLYAHHAKVYCGFDNETKEDLTNSIEFEGEDDNAETIDASRTMQYYLNLGLHKGLIGELDDALLAAEIGLGVAQNHQAEAPVDGQDVIVYQFRDLECQVNGMACSAVNERVLAGERLGLSTSSSKPHCGVKPL